jgi:peptidylprolyl isomerase
MIIRLFWDVAPLACENFATLCGNGSLLPGETGKPKPVPLGECGKPLTFRKSKFHRVIPGFVMQGGDFVFQNGSGGEAIFGKKFKDERAGLQLKHNRRGLLSMGNSGKNSNSSQFFLSFDKAPQCDGKHVIFGELVSGFEILDVAEKFGSSEGEPSVPIEITDCGIYESLQTPACGYHYDTPDPDSFTGISPVFVVRPRAIVLAPSEAVSKTFAAAMGDFVSIVAFVSGDKTTTATQQCTRITELLRKYAADVVIVAPACWKEVQPELALPKSWEAVGIKRNEAVLVAKPVEALSKIRAESWLRTKRPHWQLDGTL